MGGLGLVRDHSVLGAALSHWCCRSLCWCDGAHTETGIPKLGVVSSILVQAPPAHMPTPDGTPPLCASAPVTSRHALPRPTTPNRNHASLLRVRYSGRAHHMQMKGGVAGPTLIVGTCALGEGTGRISLNPARPLCNVMPQPMGVV